MCHPPIHLLASPRNFRATQHVLLTPLSQPYLPPALHRVPRPSPGEGLSFGRGCGWGARPLPSLPPIWILNRTQLLHGSGRAGPALTGQGGGASSEDEPPESGRDSWRGTVVRRPPATQPHVCPCRDSCQRGWRLLYIVAAYRSCSEVLQPHLVRFLQDVGRTPGLPFQGEGPAGGEPGPRACLREDRPDSWPKGLALHRCRAMFTNISPSPNVCGGPAGADAMGCLI